jgi:ABC-type spermidine/putrescine transport system permease subunit I
MVLRSERTRQVADQPGNSAASLARRRRQRQVLGYRLCTLPALLVTVLVAVVPMMVLIVMSFVDEESRTFSARYYVSTLTDPFFMRTLGTTLLMAAGVTVVSIVAAMPLAYLMARAPLFRNIVMPIISVPRMLPFVVVGYALILLMAPVTGLFIVWLNALGVIDGPLFFLFGWIGQAIAFSYSGVVVATAVLSGVMMSIDRQLEQAAVTLGATPFKAFLRVTLPLTTPGIIAASALIFTAIITAYAVPVILNSRAPYMISILIASNLLTLQQQHLAYAQAVIVTVIALTVVVSAQLALGRYGKRGA